MNGPLLVEVAGVTCRLGEITALSGVSLAIPAGEIFGVAGPNGAGKSTLLRAIAGAVGPVAGSVVVDGRDPRATPAPELARLMAVLPQRAGAPAGVAVREAVGWGRNPHMGRLARPGPHDLRAIDEAMEQTGTSALSDRPVDALSGGELRRVLIARALAQSPRVLLLDEPTVHLDIGHQVEIMDLLRRLAGRGLAVVAALHDLNLAAAYCDRMALLAGGRLLAVGTAAEVVRPDLISQAYGRTVVVRHNPATGRPYLSVAGSGPGRPSGPRIHVICGGGTGAELLARCVESGYRVSVGVVHVMDSDQAAARALGLEVVEEAPFSPVGEEAAGSAAAAARASAAVVVAPMPVGPGNLRNLGVAAEAQAAGVPVIIVDGVADRDFCGGRAAAAVDRLVAGGARVVPDLQAAFEMLRCVVPPGKGGQGAPGRRPVVAIDGPTASGKSTVARGVARRLGFRYVDTGAMYRTVALAALREGISLDDDAALGRLASMLSIEIREDTRGERVIMDGEDVGAAIRTPEVSRASSVVSAVPAVRSALVARQRDLAANGGVVMEGRDIGTVVFPDAEVKVFLDASLEARARRRHAELTARGVRIDPDEVRRQEAERDQRDETRALSPLRAAPGAVVIDTTTRDPEEIVEFIVRLVRARTSGAQP